MRLASRSRRLPVPPGPRRGGRCTAPRRERNTKNRPAASTFSFADQRYLPYNSDSSIRQRTLEYRCSLSNRNTGYALTTPPLTSTPSLPVATSFSVTGGKKYGNPALMRTASAIGKASGVYGWPWDASLCAPNARVRSRQPPQAAPILAGTCRPPPHDIGTPDSVTALTRGPASESTHDQEPRAPSRAVPADYPEFLAELKTRIASCPHSRSTRRQRRADQALLGDRARHPRARASRRLGQQGHRPPGRGSPPGLP
jgi:hypothetical protein